MKSIIKKSAKTLMLMLIVAMSACFEIEPFTSENGEVSFSGFGIELFQTGGAGDRVLANSTWKHVYKNSAKIELENKANGQKYTLDYNPNNFTQSYKITLPFGTYVFSSVVEGGEFEAFLPFKASGEFTLSSESLDVTLQATTDYGLVTVKNQYVGSAAVSTGGKTPVNLTLLADESYRFIYVKDGTATKLEITESYSGTTIERNLTMVKYRHYNFILELSEGNVNFIDLVMGAFEYEEEVIQLVSGKFYDANGTIKCPDAEPGEKGIVNGKIYEAVDRALLIQRRDEGADLTCVCTSLVTDMREMFRERNFNQQIGNWDVSNVTDMFGMFVYSTFNQPIGNWDVGNVTTMQSMFANTPFNQPIGNWDVSNVSEMSGMFSDTPFNQSIGNWNVSKVKSMYSMFLRAKSFNQPIGNWNVSSVVNMGVMLAGAENFNQPIGYWDVSSVEDMGFMFWATINFNQPIGNWDVKNVINMRAMFQVAPKFNQPIGNWDVGNVRDMGWMFAYATEFNQDISNWNLGKVTDMDRMFAYARKFNSEIGNWDVSKVTLMNVMFLEADSFNHDIGKWDVLNVQEMSGMFESANSFDQNIGSWKLTNLRAANGMFNNSGLSKTNYESTLLGWSQSNTTPSGLTLGAENIKYCDETGRNALINQFNWVIEKDLKSCD